MAQPKSKNELTEAFIKYLGCPCTAFVAESESVLTQRYQAALKQGKAEGFIPVIIIPDENLWECCKFNTAPDDLQSGRYEVKQDDVVNYRTSNIEMALDDGKQVLQDALAERTADYLEEKEPLPEGERGATEVFPQISLLLGEQLPVNAILAQLPITNPWEVFAYVPFGNWNECPDIPAFMAISKYWYDKYQAYPALITSDILNFYVEKPVDDPEAMDLAMEHFALCADIVEQGTETIANLADALVDSNYWFFWWD